MVETPNRSLASPFGGASGETVHRTVLWTRTKCRNARFHLGGASGTRTPDLLLAKQAL